MYATLEGPFIASPVRSFVRFGHPSVRTLRSQASFARSYSSRNGGKQRHVSGGGWLDLSKYEDDELVSRQFVSQQPAAGKVKEWLRTNEAMQLLGN